MIEAPLIISGTLLNGVNNPLLIVRGRFIYSRLETPIWWASFLEIFKEATGFNPIPIRIGDIPLISQYAVASLQAIRHLSDKLELTEEEVWSTLDLIDQAMFNFDVLKGIRYVQRFSSSILYRSSEDPVIVNVKPLKVRKLMSYPIDEPRFLDSSIVHLSGFLPVKLSSDFSEANVDAENGLWRMLYGLPAPPGKFKWVWDLNWASLLELLN